MWEVWGDGGIFLPFSPVLFLNLLTSVRAISVCHAPNYAESDSIRFAQHSTGNEIAPRTPDSEPKLATLPISQMASIEPI
ncbi:MAG: hypothetical protein AAGJ08_10250 [Cyanobacteria bacterium P01_H01_bin.35]